MNNWLSLTDVALAPAQRVVALNPALSPVTHGTWLQRVHVWRHTLRPFAGHSVGLFNDDPCEFAAILWGAWHAQVRPVLLPDTCEATVARVAEHVGAHIGYGEAPCLPREPSQNETLETLHESACQLAIFTSGSTGEPVLVPKHMRQLARELENLEACFGATLDDGPVYTTVPHQHIYGLLYHILWPLCSGRPLYVDNLAKRPVWPTLPRGTLISSPGYLKRLPHPPPAANLAAVFSSGGVLPSDVAKAVHAAWQVWPLEVYGSSETGGVAWRQGAAPWQPLPRVQLRIDDGHLAIQSPHLPDNGWFVSQDRARVDHGALTLLGRADRIVKIEEKRVSLTALEQAVMALPWVQQARGAVLAGHRHIVAMVVVLSTAGRDRLQADGMVAVNSLLRDALTTQFEAVVLPRRWKYVDGLPQDAMGKVTDAAITRVFDAVTPQADWRHRDATHAEAAVEITTDLRVFDGHFPGRPILPGVAQIHWAVDLARQAFALPPDVVGMEVIKFKRLLQPPCVAHVHLKWNADRQVLTFEWQRDTLVHASGRIVFGGPGA